MSDNVNTFGSLITSQIDTAPKQLKNEAPDAFGLITSQIDTAPKLSKFVDSPVEV